MYHGKATPWCPSKFTISRDPTFITCNSIWDEVRLVFLEFNVCLAHPDPGLLLFDVKPFHLSALTRRLPVFTRVGKIDREQIHK